MNGWTEITGENQRFALRRVVVDKKGNREEKNPIWNSALVSVGKRTIKISYQNGTVLIDNEKLNWNYKTLSEIET